MHKLAIRSLSDIGVPFLEQAIRRAKSDQKGAFHFKPIMDNLAKKGCLQEVMQEMKTSILTDIHNNPLLSEFRSDAKSTLNLEIDEQGRCIIKENGQVLLTCSRDAALGELCLAYYHLLQFEAPVSAKEIPLEFVA